MANPTLPHDTKKLNHDGVHIEVEGIIVDDKVVVKAQEANITNPPAGGTGATAGAFDTAANRDLMIQSINDIIQVLENHGLTADA